MIVFLVAIAIMVTIHRNWNAWHGGRVEQVTNDAYVSGDLTPLSTKVSGLESGPHTPLAQTEVHSADYPSLQAMAKEFPAQVKASVDVASFDVAGPVIDGEDHKPWALEEEGKPVANGPIAIIAPGTGLGECL